MGVAYDQLGDQKNAQNAYEHALLIKPDEPSVLSNYALSRMLAKDPDVALKLAARAESANTTADSKIARNIAMIRSMAPAATPATAAAQPAPAAHSQAAPQVAKAAPEAHDSRVVMQRVPVDPKAGPVAPAPVKAATGDTASHAPRSLQTQVAEAPHAEPHVEAPKPITSQALPPPVAPVKAAEVKPAPATMAAMPVPAAIAKATPPAPVRQAMPAAMAKLTPPAPVKPAETATASVSLRLTPPLKGEAEKPGQAPKVLPPTPVKAASKDAVPGLRVSTNAY
jgi:hypothetical protein